MNRRSFLKTFAQEQYVFRSHLFWRLHLSSAK
jgi:hypothetical protein